MMEEVSDDTNGESTFEFVSDRNDEISPKVTEALLSSSSSITTVGTTSLPMGTPPVTREMGLFMPAMQPQIGIASSETPITFYDPTAHPEPCLSEKPLPPPPEGSFPTHFYQQPINYSVTESIPQFTQANYSTLTLPTDDSPSGFPDDTNAGMWSWFKGKRIFEKVAEKAKSSVDTVITTLDPGMKEIINTGGDINVLVASGNETKVSAIREAFQSVFGKATVQGVTVQSSSIAPQPVGFSAGLKAAEERIMNLRQQGLASESQIFVAVENFLAEITPENWFDLGCLLLWDFSSNIMLQVYTEAIPVPNAFVTQAKEQTSLDYPLGWSGFAVTIGQIIAPSLGVHHSEWQEALTGVSRREILLLAAKTLAGIYKRQLKR